MNRAQSYQTNKCSSFLVDYALVFKEEACLEANLGLRINEAVCLRERPQKFPKDGLKILIHNFRHYTPCWLTGSWGWCCPVAVVDGCAHYKMVGWRV